MSTPRIYMSGASADLVISKVGFDASNSALADANKIFDSDWLFGGSIIKKGIYVIPADGSSHTISFPEQSEAPAITFWRCIPSGYYGSPDYQNNFGTVSQLQVGGPNAPQPSVTTTGVVFPGTTSGNVFLNSTDAGNNVNRKYAIILIVHGF